MKFTLLSAIVFLTSVFSQTAAQIELNSFPSDLQVGQTYPLSWNATEDYTYTIWLVLQNPVAGGLPWIKLWIVATDLRYDSLEASYDWTVPSNISAQGNHALNVDAEDYSDTTDWFTVSSAATAPSPSASPSESSGSSPTSSTVPHQTSSTSSSGDHSSSTVSGGSIAGIVVGCLVGIALVGGALLFYFWRKRRTGVQKREAAARAGRLAPVMEESAPSSYEMHGTPPQQQREFLKSSAV